MSRQECSYATKIVPRQRRSRWDVRQPFQRQIGSRSVGDRHLAPECQVTYRGANDCGARHILLDIPWPRDRMIALHARSLTFLHPIRYEPVTVVAPLPEAWRELGIAEESPPVATGGL